MEEKKKIENIENLDPEDLKDVNGGAILFDADVAVNGVRKGKDKTNHAAGDDPGKKKESAPRSSFSASGNESTRTHTSARS